MPSRLVTVVEVPPFSARAARIWSEDDKSAFIDFIARNPHAGDDMPGTGGLRKVRWTRPGMGKRGGARVVYFFHDDNAPLFLLTAYAKSDQADLSADGRRAMRRLAQQIRDEISTQRLKRGQQ
jgi:hypothetical protein